jgi:hypothetical protein
MNGGVPCRYRVWIGCSGVPIWAPVLIVMSIFPTIAAKGQVSHGSSTNQQSAETSIAADPKLPACPPAGLPTLQSSPQKTGHHTITLSWQRSASSSNSDSQAVGYCLYRSKEQNAAKQNATCSHCEQINSIPLADTACVDDLVEDGATYYYVVTAINTKGRISSSSNEILAQVPSNQESANSISAESHPLCRGTKGLK